MENEQNGRKDSATMAEEPSTKFRRRIGMCRIAVFALSVLCLALFIALIVVSVKLSESLSEEEPDMTCAERSNMINLDPPDVLPPFHDLTESEITAVKDFLYGQKDLNLVRPPHVETNSSYIFTMELNIPNKEVTLNYLDNGKAQPPREAKVVIFRGDKPENYVEEYVVGPLPFPVAKKNQKTYSFRYRPFTFPELIASAYFLTERVHATAAHILEESYGGKLLECGDKCLKFEMFSRVSSAITGDPRTRKCWFTLVPDVEYKSLHNLDFQVLMDLTSSKREEFRIEKVLYAGETFNNLEDLVESYKYGGRTKTKIPFPTMDENLFSTLHRRGTLFPDEPLLPPEQYSPDGLRYSIQGRRVTYMGWDFNIGMSPIFGPQMFDIRYQGKRIVYELSLQEVAVMYSGHAPPIRFVDVADSAALIGISTRRLVPGYDCPKYATYMNSDQMHEFVDDTLKSAYCVFEHNTGVPLRRHQNSQSPRFYEGMVDTVLTLRTIASIVNYDYIIDFIFHQNGALEVKVVPTGFIMTTFWNNLENDYGFRLKEHITGSLHIHLFHFKVDMDINGRENRFETLDIVPTEVDNSKWSKIPNARYHQTKVVRSQVQTEKDAALKYNFDAPKYLTFYNNKHKSAYGVPKAYRLLVNGMVKQLYPENQGSEASFSWARYQVAVSKYKEDERRSSSLYAGLDANSPIVNFQGFLDDNEIISDEDQVTWVTMGLHHIPHTEDLPVTPTVGLAMQFFLLPYNYFPEDPAMGSSDAIRIEPRVASDVSKGVRVERYGRKANQQCIPRKELFRGKDYSKLLNEVPWILFDP